MDVFSLEVAVKAMVIDDSRAMRVILRKLLAAEGLEVFEAVDGDDALRQLELLGPLDVALIDWNMPGMNGVTFVRAIRKNRRFDPMRLVLATTESEEAQAEALGNLGADAYLTKPFSREVLADKLGALLGPTGCRRPT